MEAFNQTTENRLTLKLSENQSISTKTIRREQHAAIFSVINKSRGTLGWQLRKAAELNEQILIWAEAFDFYKIPFECYELLFQRARDLRINRLQNGLECPDFTAELLIAGWIGENGLEREIHRREVEAKNRLPEVAESVCPRCFGTNVEFVYSPLGEKLGCRASCRHAKLQPGEWLWKAAQKAAEDCPGFS